MVKLTTSGNTPRLYKGPGGVLLPGVTTVLKVLDDTTWMNSYIARKGRRELDTLRTNAAVLGTKIHALAERAATDRTYEPADEEMRPYHDAIREFYALHVRRVIATEFSLVSVKERVGGTLDAYVEMANGERAVLDIKCKRSSGITDVNRAQTAGYALLLRDNGYTVNRRVILRLHTSEGKRGQWYAKSAPDHAGDVRAFRAAVELYWWRHGRKLEGKKSA